jgi:hypothetical protein
MKASRMVELLMAQGPTQTITGSRMAALVTGAPEVLVYEDEYVVEYRTLTGHTLETALEWAKQRVQELEEKNT